MEAGVADHVWTIEKVISLLEYKELTAKTESAA